MGILPQVVRAEYRGGHRIHLAFGDGREKTVDFLPWLSGPVFEPLKDEEYFRPPETLYAAKGVGLASGKFGGLTAEQFLERP